MGRDRREGQPQGRWRGLVAYGQGAKHEKQGATRLCGQVQASQFGCTDGIHPAKQGRTTAALEYLFGSPPGVAWPHGIDAQELLNRQVPACPASNIGEIGRVQHDHRLRLASPRQHRLQQSYFTNTRRTIQ